jgi:DHA1 family tetracycline resistance protein-like MFS transporter
MQSRLALVFILVTVAIDSIGIGIIFPVMPALLTEVTISDLSHAALWGGVLATAFAAMQFLFGPVVGNLSDRYGRRPVMLAALAVMAVDYVIMALADTVWLLLAGRLVAGIAASTYATAGAYIADVSAPADRAKNFGLMGAAFGVGFVLGPLLGGLASLIDTRAPFWAAGAIAALNLTLGWFVLPESLPADRRRPFSLARANPLAAFRAIGRLPGLRRFLVLMFVFTVAMTTYPAIWSFYGAERFGWDGWWIGVSLALYGLSLAVTQAVLVQPAIRRWGEMRTAGYAMALDAVAFLFYGFVTSGLWALVFTPVTALSGVAGPALQALMANATPDDQQGELQGVLAAVAAVASSVAPLVLTAVFYQFTRPGAPVYAPGAPFLLSAVLMVLCVVILAGVRRPAPATAP